MAKRRSKRIYEDDRGKKRDREVGYFTSSLTSLDWRTIAPIVGFAVVVGVVIIFIVKSRSLGKQAAHSNVAPFHNPGPIRTPDGQPVKPNPAIADDQVNVPQNRNPAIVRGYDPDFLNTAAMEAWFGQDDDLAVTCEQTLKFLKDTKNATMAERAAKICSLRPLNDKTHRAALILARRAVEFGKGHGFEAYFQMALGMAEYRSGNYAKADGVLLTASQLGKDNYAVSCTSAFYRAMSLFRQGKKAEAHNLAAEAIAKMKPLPADERNPLVGNANADDLILWMAYKESKELLER